MAIGPAADDVSRDFERYWTSPSARPAKELLPVAEAPNPPGTVVATDAMKHPAAAAYLEAIAGSRFVNELLSGELKFEWVAVTMVSDDPAKALDRASKQQMLWPHIRDLLDGVTEKLLLISPYFVPGSDGVAFFSAMARKGVRITVLTNSLEATDNPAVHAGYARRRHPLIRAGISLFELKRTSSAPRRRRLRGWSGSSGSSLHAKTFSIDGRRAFVGSFNFDPRSARLNTELGFVIESRALADAITDTVAAEVPGGAYRVGLRDAGGLEWAEQRDGEERIHEREPGVSIWRRFVVYLLSLLPIEWLL
jgi:putative cardiolipin synthase